MTKEMEARRAEIIARGAEYRRQQPERVAAFPALVRSLLLTDESSRDMAIEIALPNHHGQADVRERRELIAAAQVAIPNPGPCNIIGPSYSPWPDSRQPRPRGEKR